MCRSCSMPQVMQLPVGLETLPQLLVSFVRVAVKVVEGKVHITRHLAFTFLETTCTSSSVVAG